MISTIFRIAGYFFRQRKTVVQKTGPGTASIFWKTPYLRDEDVPSILQQWESYLPHLSNLFGDQKRYVFSQLEINIQGRTFIPKVYKTRKLSQNLIALLFSEAERNCATMTHLHDNGFRVPVPVGVFNTYKRFWLVQSVFFQEKLPSSCTDYKTYLKDVQAMSSESRLAFYTQLGESLGRLHALGVYTEDTDKNMMVDAPQPGIFTFYYFDFDNFYPWRYPTLRRAGHAIRHYADSDHYTCTPKELDVFLNAYLLFLGKPQWREPVMANLRHHKPHIFSQSAHQTSC